jgi:hypothetical protein
MCEDGYLRYALPEEGEVELGLDMVRDRVSFYQADLQYSGKIQWI